MATSYLAVNLSVTERSRLVTDDSTLSTVSSSTLQNVSIVEAMSTVTEALTSIIGRRTSPFEYVLSMCGRIQMAWPYTQLDFAQVIQH